MTKSIFYGMKIFYQNKIFYRTKYTLSNKKYFIE